MPNYHTEYMILTKANNTIQDVLANYLDSLGCDNKWHLFAVFLVCALVASMSAGKFALTNFIEFLLLIIILSTPLLRASFLRVLRVPEVKVMLLFWLWVGIAMMWGQAPTIERIDEFFSWRKFLILPICLVLFNTRALKNLFLAVFVSMFFIYLVISYAGFFQLVAFSTHYNFLVENHATQSIVFVISSLILFFFSIRSRNTTIKIIFVLLAITFLLNVLFVSTGRSGYFFVVFGVSSLLLVEKFRYKRAVCVLALVCGLTMAIQSEVVRERVGVAITEIGNEIKGVSESGTSAGARWVMWNITIEMIAEQPMLGSGSGSFKYDYEAQNRQTKGWASSMGSDDPHQQYLLIAGEQGIIGLILFCSMIFVWFRALLVSQNQHRSIGIAVLLSTVASSFFNGHFGTFVEGRLLLLMLATALAFEWTQKNNQITK